MAGVCPWSSPDCAAIDCQCTEMLQDDWTSAAGPSAVPRANQRAFPYCPLDVRRTPPVMRTPEPGHTQRPPTTQDSTAKSGRRYSDVSSSLQPPEPHARTDALSLCSLVLNSLPATHTGAKWSVNRSQQTVKDSSTSSVFTWPSSTFAVTPCRR